MRSWIDTGATWKKKKDRLPIPTDPGRQILHNLLEHPAQSCRTLSFCLRQVSEKLSRAHLYVHTALLFLSYLFFFLTQCTCLFSTRMMRLMMQMKRRGRSRRRRWGEKRICLVARSLASLSLPHQDSTTSRLTHSFLNDSWLATSWLLWLMVPLC